MMFLVIVGFGIIIPVLPFLAEKVGGNSTELGLLMAGQTLNGAQSTQVKEEDSSHV